MPLESISNAQFMSFVNFAREAEANGNGKTIARLGKPNGQGVRAISVQSGPVNAVKLFKPEFKLAGLCVVEYKATLAG